MLSRFQPYKEYLLEDIERLRAEYYGKIVPRSSISPKFRAKGDILMILESPSTSDEFDQQLNFCANFTKGYDLEKTVKVSVMIIGKNQHRHFGFDRFSDHSSLSEALSNMPYLGTSSGTDFALKVARRESFGHRSKRRSNVKQISLVLTECHAQNEEEATEQAKQLKEKSHVMVVGIKCSKKSKLLETMASSPKDLYSAQTYQQLENRCVNLKMRVAEHAPEFPSTADILFILDSSSSIGEVDYTKELDFVVDLTECFNIGPDAVRFSAMTFSSSTEILFDFNLTSHKYIKRVTMDASYIRGSTDTALALNEARTKVFPKKERRRGKRIAIVITDGQSNDPEATALAAKTFHDAGILVVAIGVGNANPSELSTIASREKDVFYVDNYNVLMKIRENLAEKMSSFEDA